MGRKLVSTRPRAHTAGNIPRPPATHVSPSQKDNDDSWPAFENGELITTATDNTSTCEPKRSHSFSGRGRFLKSGAISNATPTVQTGKKISRPRPPLPTAENEAIRHDMIGIALGSPTKDTIKPYPMTTTIVTAPAMNSHKTEMKEANGSGTETLRRKPSKWRKLGGLFRAKSVEASLNSRYQTQAHNQSALPSRGQQEPSTSRSRPKTPTGKLRSDSRPKTGWRSPSKKEEASPAKKKETESSKKQKKNKPTGKLVKDADAQKHWGALAEEPEAEQTRSSNQPAKPSQLLDVDIPSLEMERYSVMFGGVFGEARRTSLLARRSRTLEQLRTEEERPNTGGGLAPPQRSMTTPIPTKSPTFTLFPPASANRNSKVPGSHISPSGPPPPKTQIPSNLKSTLGAEENPGSSSSHHLRWTSESSFLSDTSDGESDNGIEAVRLQARPPRLSEHEPEWEIINPPRPSSRQSKPALPAPANIRKIPPFLEMSSSNTSRSTLVNIQDEPTSTITPASTHPPSAINSDKLTTTLPSRAKSLRYTPSPSRSPPRRSPLRSKTTSKLKPPTSRHNLSSSIDSIGDEIQPIEISVARSISVSKRHRQTLVPVGGQADILKAGERLVPKRVGTPTQQAVQKGHRHEKSRVAVFEYA